MSIIVWIVIGGLAGWIANMLMKTTAASSRTSSRESSARLWADSS